MYKIVHIPLDERPCNYDFPYKIFNSVKLNVVRVPLEDLGLKKKSGNIAKINEFLAKECIDADVAIIAIDTLLYGGIVPSRLHFENKDDLMKRIQILRDIKKKRPKIKIYAYNLVMRCPGYDDDDEEPDYYQYFGYALFKKAYIEDKRDCGFANDEELKELETFKIPNEFKDDYEFRRGINVEVTKNIIELVKEGIIDFLIVPQDDSAPYGYTAIDQRKIKESVTKYNLEMKVLTYPGADEVSCTLFARVLNEINNKKPLVYVKYPSNECAYIIPSAEDRPLDISVRYQIVAAGCLLASSVSEADIIWAINAPTKKMIATQFREYKDDGYGVYRNLIEFTEFIDYCISLNKPVTIGDIGYCNGGDLELIACLNAKNLYMKLAGYASWNIPCNSLGTALAMGVNYFNKNNTTKNHFDFLIHRFVEDVGYCTLVRKIVRAEYCEKMGYTIYDIGAQRGDFSRLVEKLIYEQVSIYMPAIANNYVIKDIYMPWSRTYEVGLQIEYKERKDV